MHNIIRTLTIAFMLMSLLSACRKTENDHTYVVRFFVASEQNSPIQAVDIALAGHNIGATDDQGHLKTQVNGAEGDRIAVRIVCPKKYATPEPPEPLVLQRIRKTGVNGQSANTELIYSAKCNRLEHRTVVMLKTKNVKEIPLSIRGGGVIALDDEGVGHVLLEGKPGTMFQLQWNTEKFPDVRPQNPEKTVTIGNEDDIIYVEQPFEKIIKRKNVKRAAPIKLPMRID